MVAATKLENETALVPYSLEAAVIEGLKAKYLDVTIPPDDRAAYAMVMSGLRECREIRLAVDAWHKDKKAWIVQAGKHYDSERRRVHALVEPIEAHLADVRKVEDDRKEAIRAEAERKERERVEGIRAKIAEISLKVIDTQGKNAKQIKEMEENLFVTPILPTEFQEFEAEANSVKSETLRYLKNTYEARLKWEAEQAAAKAESERLEKIRQEQEAERKRIQAEKGALAAEKKALEDAKRAEEERKDREEFERKAREEAKTRAEAEAKERVEREAHEKQEREKAEAVERARQEALLPDKQKVWKYFDRILEIPEPEVSKQVYSLIQFFSGELGELMNKVRADLEEL